jgi:glycerol-3-phosphate acyltransferase PlsY
MNWQMLVLALLVGYLAGSISFTRLVVRIMKPEEKLEEMEVPVEGTDLKYKVTTFGATAASMSLGAKAGCAVGFADMVKVAVPVLVFRILFPGESYMLAAAVGGMAGHNWPVFYKFKGGRGISAYYGGLFIIDWVGALVTMIAGMILGFVIVKDFFVAYMAGLWLLLPWVWLTTQRMDYLIYAVVVNIFYIAAMLPDIKQYMKIRREVKVDSKMVLETNPMGRGMLKISEWLKNTFSHRD